jgi:hypothetical protein
VVVLREYATIRWDAGVATRPRRGAAAGSLGLLLGVQEPPARAPSPLHRVLVPGFVEVRLATLHQLILSLQLCTQLSPSENSVVLLRIYIDGLFGSSWFNWQWDSSGWYHAHHLGVHNSM